MTLCVVAALRNLSMYELVLLRLTLPSTKKDHVQRLTALAKEVERVIWDAPVDQFAVTLVKLATVSTRISRILSGDIKLDDPVKVGRPLCAFRHAAHSELSCPIGRPDVRAGPFVARWAPCSVAATGRLLAPPRS